MITIRFVMAVVRTRRPGLKWRKLRNMYSNYCCEYFFREKYKSEYEMKLRDELDTITTKTSTELDKIKNHTKEMYERENRYKLRHLRFPCATWKLAEACCISTSHPL